MKILGFSEPCYVKDESVIRFWWATSVLKKNQKIIEGYIYQNTLLVIKVLLNWMFSLLTPKIIVLYFLYFSTIFSG